MKYALVFAVVIWGFWLWRSNRRTSKIEKNRSAQSAEKPSPQSGRELTPQPIVPCAFCGVHLPQDSALIGKQGSYCGLEHRKKAEG